MSAAGAGLRMIGQLVGGCRLERALAPGAFGTLYAGRDERSGEARVVKLLAPGTARSDTERAEAVRHFELEAQALQRLHHPGIVRCLGAGHLRGQAYLVMELLPGCDLRRYAQPARRLPPPAVAWIGAQIASALAHAHALGVVHRDIKPANVMVDWPSRRVVLTDFGVARLGDAQATATGVVMGTPAYMAPELLAGAPAGPAADLYALGVLLYELLSSRLPLRADALGELLRQIAQDAPPPLAGLQPEVPAPLAECVHALLAKDPGRRPPTAEGVARSLAGESHARP